MDYSRTQQVTLALISKLTASIAMICSSTIIIEVIRDQKDGVGNPIVRILLGVTSYEICDAIGWFISSWAVPRNTGFAFAAGNISSCNFQGWLLQVAIGAPLCNALMTYFFYLLVNHKKNTDYLRSIEIRCHIVIALYAIGTAFLLLFLEIYNPIGNICWINGSPPLCDTSSINGNPNIPCDRGHNAFIYGIVFFYTILWFAIITIIYMNWSMRRILIQHSSPEVDWLTTQALLYSVAFFITWIPSTLWSIFKWTKNSGGQGFFWLDLLAAIFEPAQGIWNLLIFIRNRPQTQYRIQYVLYCCYCCRRRRRHVAIPIHNCRHHNNQNGSSIIVSTTQKEKQSSSSSSSNHNIGKNHPNRDNDSSNNNNNNIIAAHCTQNIKNHNEDHSNHDNEEIVIEFDNNDNNDHVLCNHDIDNINVIQQHDTNLELFHGLDQMNSCYNNTTKNDNDDNDITTDDNNIDLIIKPITKSVRFSND